MAEVLDYSSGYPTPQAVLGAGFVGVVRYVGTPGRRKNITPAEARAFLAGGVPIALVYEDTAGWMRGGSRAGISAARAVEADAASCGLDLRCCYLACDEDVTTGAQMASVMACLDGASTVWGLGVTGVYGEADVIDACLGQRHATWGWQTRAWSGGALSTQAHLYQHAGYVTVGGIQCDRNTVLKPDWGQVPRPGNASVTEEDEVPLTDTDTTAIAEKLATNRAFRLAIRGELIAALADPTHQYLRDDIQQAERPMADAIAESFATVGIAQGSLTEQLQSLSEQMVALVSLPQTQASPVDVSALADQVVSSIARRLAGQTG